MNELVRVEWVDRVECVRCLALVGLAHDGKAVHAIQRHPGVRNFEDLYRPAEKWAVKEEPNE